MLTTTLKKTLKTITINLRNIRGANMKRVKRVPANEREQLKAIVDSAGRPLVAAAIDMPYGSLASKLTGILPLSQAEYDKILSACQRIGGKE